mgnify:CR=1 FL=1
MLLAVAVDAELDAGLFRDFRHGLLGRVQLVAAGTGELGGVHVVGPERLAQHFGFVTAHADPVLLGDGVALCALLLCQAALLVCQGALLVIEAVAEATQPAALVLTLVTPETLEV